MGVLRVYPITHSNLSSYTEARLAEFVSITLILFGTGAYGVVAVYIVELREVTFTEEPGNTLNLPIKSTSDK